MRDHTNKNFEHVSVCERVSLLLEKLTETLDSSISDLLICMHNNEMIRNGQQQMRSWKERMKCTELMQMIRKARARFKIPIDMSCIFTCKLT